MAKPLFSYLVFAFLLLGLLLTTVNVYAKYVPAPITYQVTLWSSRGYQLESIDPISGYAMPWETIYAGKVKPDGAEYTLTWEYSYDPSDPVNYPFEEVEFYNEPDLYLQDYDIDLYFRVKATGINAYSGTVYSPVFGPVSNNIYDLYSIGDIQGSPRLYEPLTAGDTDPLAATVSYQWYRSTSILGPYTAITGARSRTYSPVSADYDHHLKVEAIGYGNYIGTVMSYHTEKVAAAPLSSVDPIIDPPIAGTAVHAGTVYPTTASYSLQWLVADTPTSQFFPIPGATYDDYVIPQDQLGKYLRLSVTGINGYTGTLVTDYIGPVVSNITPLVSVGPITGNPVVLETLEVSALEPAGATVRYQWQWSSSGEEGSWYHVYDHNDSFYEVHPADSDLYLRVIATGLGAYTGEVISEMTPKIQSKPITGISEIIGTVNPGMTLNAGTVQPIGALVSYQWLRSLDDVNYEAISGANSSSYTIANEDVDYHLKLQVTGVGGFSGVLMSNATLPVQPVYTDLVAIDAVSGVLRVGRLVVAGQLSPSSATVTYQWQRGSTSSGSFADIPGAVSMDYTIQSEDLNKYLRVVATGSGYYLGAVTSPVVGPVTPTVLSYMDPIQGASKPGSTLSAGQVYPEDALVSYQWMKASSEFAVYEDIIGATQNAFTPSTSDLGYYFKVRVTGTGAYTGSLVSHGLGPVVAEIIPLESLGAITGELKVGGLVSASSLSPSSATANYQWEVYEPATDSYSPITGQTQSSLEIIPLGYNRSIRLTATGTGAYSGTVSSPLSGPIAKGTLSSIGAITGTIAQNSTVQAGTLQPLNATASYEWYLRRSNSTLWESLIVFDSSYMVTVAKGDFIRVKATGTGSFEGEVWSPEALVPKQTTPITSMGSISGTLTVNYWISAGVLSPAGATATFIWETAPTANGPFTVINNANAQQYYLRPEDCEQFIRVTAIGTGQYTGSFTSAVAGPIQPYRITAIENISGRTQPGELLSVGAVTPANANVSYQWKRSLSRYGTYVDIPGANGAFYTISEADRDHYLRVTAVGHLGFTGQMTTHAFGPVVDALIPIESMGALSGELMVEGELNAGSVVPATANIVYHWEKAALASGPFTEISASEATSLVLGGAEVDQYIRLVARGEGAYTGELVSNVVGPIAPRPITAISNIIGSSVVGETLMAGTTTPSGAEVDYQWYYYPNTPITGQTGSSLTLTDLDKGNAIFLSVTGKNGYTGTVSSQPSGVVKVNVKKVLDIGPITGTPQIGQTLYAGPVTVQDNNPNPTVNYQWQVAQTISGPWYAIPGATGPSHFVVTNCADRFVRVVVSGTEEYGGTVYSAPTLKVNPRPIESLDPVVGEATIGTSLFSGEVYPLGANVNYQWQESASLNGTYRDVLGATGSRFDLSQVNEGFYYRIRVTGTSGYTGTLTSTGIGPVSSSTSLSMGNIIGAPVTETILQAGPVTPSGATYDYQWQVAMEAGGQWYELTGEVTDSLNLYVEDYGSYFRVMITGTGAYAGQVVYSNSVGPVDYPSGMMGARVAPEVPAMMLEETSTPLATEASSTETALEPTATPTAEPTPETLTDINGLITENNFVVGQAYLGEELRFDQESWPELSLQFQWQRALTADGEYLDIPEADQATYRITEADLGTSLRLVIEGTSRYTGILESKPLTPALAPAPTEDAATLEPTSTPVEPTETPNPEPSVTPIPEESLPEPTAEPTTTQTVESLDPAQTETSTATPTTEPISTPEPSPEVDLSTPSPTPSPELP